MLLIFYLFENNFSVLSFKQLCTFSDFYDRLYYKKQSCVSDDLICLFNNKQIVRNGQIFCHLPT